MAKRLELTKHNDQCFAHPFNDRTSRLAMVLPITDKQDVIKFHGTYYRLHWRSPQYAIGVEV